MVIKRLIELDAAHPRHIAIIGDALTDIWIVGRLEFSQDGCDKFIETYKVITSGGAANAKNCLSDWNVRCDLFVGDIGTKIRYLVDDKIVFRVDKDIRSGSCEMLDMSLYDVILLCDYDKGFLSPEFISHAAKHPICVADVKREASLYAGSILKGNADYTGLLDIVTRGADRPLVRGQPIRHANSPVKCINHVGAGDCFAAHLVLALAYGFSLEEAAIIAHSAGRVYVQHPYNRHPRKTEILAEGPHTPMRNKV